MNGKLSFLTRTRERRVASFDETNIWYRSVGRGVPIVCCNGLGCSTFYFSYVEDYFKKTHQVITWDYRGHGKSEPPHLKKNNSILCLTRDLKAVLDHLQIKRAVLLGHSMGTQVIYEFYANYPNRCLSLIPCFGTFEKPMDTFFNSPISKYVFEVIYIFNQLFPKTANLIGTMIAKNPFWFQLGGLFNMMKPYLVDKKILQQYLDHIIHVDPIFLSNLTRNLQEHSAETVLKKIKVPTLILAGEEDAFTPVWVSKKIHHLIPNSELMIIKKGSHVALVEQPELINLRIEKFLRERISSMRPQSNILQSRRQVI